MKKIKKNKQYKIVELLNDEGYTADFLYPFQIGIKTNNNKMVFKDYCVEILNIEENNKLLDKLQEVEEVKYLCNTHEKLDLWYKAKAGIIFDLKVFVSKKE